MIGLHEARNSDINKSGYPYARNEPRCEPSMSQSFYEALDAAVQRGHIAAYRWLGNHEEARDACQEAAVRALAAKDRYDARRCFYPWFYRILRNACFDWLRRRKKRARDGLEMDIPDQRFRPDSLAGRDEVREAVWEGIGKLSERDREIIVLRHFQHLSYQEIAKALCIPQGTVMSRLFTARKRLREHLDGLILPEDL